MHSCSAGRDHESTRTLTEAQRDSVLARSILPGAGVVGRAMSASDAGSKRADDMKAMMDSLPH